MRGEKDTPGRKTCSMEGKMSRKSKRRGVGRVGWRCYNKTPQLQVGVRVAVHTDTISTPWGRAHPQRTARQRERDRKKKRRGSSACKCQSTVKHPGLTTEVVNGSHITWTGHRPLGEGGGCGGLWFYRVIFVELEFRLKTLNGNDKNRQVTWSRFKCAAPQMLASWFVLWMSCEESLIPTWIVKFSTYELNFFIHLCKQLYLYLDQTEQYPNGGI